MSRTASGPVSPIGALMRREGARQGPRLWIAALSAAGAAASAVALLGLSGGFLAGAALAGAAGPAAVTAFNYLLPSAAIRFLAIARTGLRYADRLAGHEAALKVLAEIRPALFAGLAAGPAARALGLAAGEATARLVQDVDALETSVVRRSAPWAALAAALAAAALIALANRWAVLVFLAALAVQVGAGLWIGRNRSHAPAGEALRATGDLKARFQAYVRASAELRCYGLADMAVEDLMALDARLGAATLRGWAAVAEMGMVQPAITGLAVAGVLALCAPVSLPLAALAALSAGVALEGANGLLLAFDRLGALGAATTRLDEMLTPPPARPRLAGALGDGGAPVISLRLGDQDARLAPGEAWALLGPSGAGKTRLLEALLGLIPPEGARIDIAGRPVETLDPQALRALFAYAPQDAAMISGTVRDNLALADPTAPDAAMYEVLGAARLAEKVDRMPGGLDAWIGEGGASLSGGERRRLCLARALLRPAPWLLLDEPTEGLDAETEARVIEALSRRLARTGQGLILVSHRPAPLRLCARRIQLPPTTRLSRDPVPRRDARPAYAAR